MWITGNISDFTNRLHQLPSGIQDLVTGSYVEGQLYTGISTLNQNIKWNREFNLQFYRFTNNGQMLATGKWFI